MLYPWRVTSRVPLIGVESRAVALGIAAVAALEVAVPTLRGVLAISPLRRLALAALVSVPLVTLGLLAVATVSLGLLTVASLGLTPDTLEVAVHSRFGAGFRSPASPRGTGNRAPGKSGRRCGGIVLNSVGACPMELAVLARGSWTRYGCLGLLAWTRRIGCPGPRAWTRKIGCPGLLAWTRKIGCPGLLDWTRRTDFPVWIPLPAWRRRTGCSAAGDCHRLVWRHRSSSHSRLGWRLLASRSGNCWSFRSSPANLGRRSHLAGDCPRSCLGLFPPGGPPIIPAAICATEDSMPVFSPPQPCDTLTDVVASWAPSATAASG